MIWIMSYNSETMAYEQKKSDVQSSINHPNSGKTRYLSHIKS